MEGKTAILIGATGAVGSKVLDQLLADPDYGCVRVFGRRECGLEHEKLDERIIDFDIPSGWINDVMGDVLYCCLGTTKATAGSTAAQYKVDYTYQYQFAGAAAQNGCRILVVCSSTGADPDSKLFYPRMKGELDRDVCDFPYHHISIVRPSMIDAKRKQFRLGETIGIALGKLLPIIPGLSQYRPIKPETIARAMRNAVHRNTGEYCIYELEEVFELAAG